MKITRRSFSLSALGAPLLGLFRGDKPVDAATPVKTAVDTAGREYREDVMYANGVRYVPLIRLLGMGRVPAVRSLSDPGNIENRYELSWIADPTAYAHFARPRDARDEGFTFAMHSYGEDAVLERIERVDRCDGDSLPASRDEAERLLACGAFVRVLAASVPIPLRLGGITIVDEPLGFCYSRVATGGVIE